MLAIADLYSWVYAYIYLSIYRYGILCVTLTYCSTNKWQICENIMQFSYYRINRRNRISNYEIHRQIRKKKNNSRIFFYRQHQHSNKIDSIEIEQTTFFLPFFLSHSLCVCCLYVTLVFLFFVFCNRVSRRNFCASHKFQWIFTHLYTRTQ